MKAPRELSKWTKRLEAMKRCRTPADLINDHGAPPHKVQYGSMEIWHYPLGAADGTLYSIHAAVESDQVSQVYMHMEPTTETAPAFKRPWWQFWR